MSHHISVRRSTRFAASETVHFLQFDNEMVILDLTAGQYYSLNEVGSGMWHALVAGRTPEEVAAILVEEYSVDLEVLVADCIFLTEELLRRGLLRTPR